MLQWTRRYHLFSIPGALGGALLSKVVRREDYDDRLMWKCPKCGEEHDDALQSCWKCASPGRIARKVQDLLSPHIVLSLQEYLALIRGLPLPSAEQRRDFIDYITGAHSWYKHLPRYLPGTPFYFFIDKYGGCDRIALQDGSHAMAEREKPGFHYSAIPTVEYRTRFGFLNYACTEATAVFFVNQQRRAIPRDKVVAIPGEKAQPRCLPKAILDTGKVELTAVIHPLSAAYDFWDLRGAGRRADFFWPSESGGSAALQEIFERCAQMRQPGYREERQARHAKCLEVLKSRRTPNEAPDTVQRGQLDPILAELLEPERARQKSEMLRAIDRVCILIQEAGSSAAARSC